MVKETSNNLRELAQKLFEEIGDRWDDHSAVVWRGKKVLSDHLQWAQTGENYPERSYKTVNVK